MDVRRLRGWLSGAHSPAGGGANHLGLGRAKSRARRSTSSGQARQSGCGIPQPRVEALLRMVARDQGAVDPQCLAGDI